MEITFAELKEAMGRTWLDEEERSSDTVQVKV